MTSFVGRAKFNLAVAEQFRFETLSSFPFVSGEVGRGALGSDGKLRINDGVGVRVLRDTSVALVDGDIATGAAIQLTKLAEDPRQRSTHQGSQPVSSLSDFSTAVRAVRLDEFAAPTAAVALNGQRVTNVGTPTQATDAATKQYVDGLVSGAQPARGGSVRVAYSTNITLSGAAPAEGGVTPSNGQRVLVKGQTNAAQNGIRIVNTGGAWPRATDADIWAEIPGQFVFVEEGSVADTGWVATADQGGTLDTTAIGWVKFSSPGDYSAGNGLTLTGLSFSLNVDNSSLEIFGGSARVKTAGITNGMLAGGIDLTSKVSGVLPPANGGTGANSISGARDNLAVAARYSNGGIHAAGASITITAATHGCGASKNKLIAIIRESDGEVVDADPVVASNGDITITFATSWAANTWRVVIVGW